MRHALLLILALGCAPPDPIDVSGSTGVEIRVLYPEPELNLRLDEDGMLRTLVVVDMIGLEFLPPGTTSDVQLGIGHYHLFVQETQYITSPSSLAYELETDAFRAGQRGIINVDLRENNHDVFEEDGCDCTASVEFNVLATE
ncbi:MAG: hypothetical protein ACI9MC_003300 [Kiritimatiellia bacterium]|jgi:hypothetical protein